MLNRLTFVTLIAARTLFGWGCEGHQTVALIAEANLSPHALEHVKALLGSNPIDPNLIRFCAQGREDLLADASTWPDDARRTDGTGKWHYMDIPRQVTSGDPQKYCEPVGPPGDRGERAGCVFTAIIYNRDILANEQAAPADRARALRYLIHFVGDLHQPLHTTDNKDQGGNCTSMVLLHGTTISNLHSIWDSGILEDHFREMQSTPAKYAAELNQRFAAHKMHWAPKPFAIDTWIWESHAAGDETTYGALQPPIPMEPVTGKTDCNAESQKVYALKIVLGPDYVAKAVPVIDQQLAKAGFRLAEMLNEIWP